MDNLKRNTNFQNEIFYKRYLKYHKSQNNEINSSLNKKEKEKE